MARWLIGLLVFALSGCQWVMHLDKFTHDDARGDVGDDDGHAFDDAPVTPIKFVQGMSASTSVTTATATLPGPLAQGHLLVVIVEWVSNHTVMVGDTASNVFRAAGGLVTISTIQQTMFYTENTNPIAAESVTATFDSGANGNIRVLEFSGIATSDAMDIATSDSNIAKLITGSPLTTTQAHELVVAGITGQAALTPDPTMIAGPSFGPDSISEYRVVFEAGTYSAPATQFTSARYVHNAAAFKGAQ